MMAALEDAQRDLPAKVTRLRDHQRQHEPISGKDALPDMPDATLMDEPFSRLSHAFTRHAVAHLTLPAIAVYTVLLGLTLGYQQTTVRIGLTALCYGRRIKDGTLDCEGTGLSRPTVIAGIRDLVAKRLITVSGGQRSRQTYTMLPSSAWCLDAQTGKASLPDGARTPKLVKHIDQAGKASLPDAAQTGKDSLPAIKIGEIDTPPKIEASPSSDDDTPSRSRSPKPSSPRQTSTSKGSVAPPVRRTTGKAAAASKTPTTPKAPPRRTQDQAIYVRELLEALKAVVGLKGKMPAEERERGHAGFFLTAGPDGGPVPIADVVACYKALKDDPWWRYRPVGMQKLSEHFVEYQRDPAGFCAALRAKSDNATRTGSRKAGPHGGHHGTTGSGQGTSGGPSRPQRFDDAYYADYERRRREQEAQWD